MAVLLLFTSVSPCAFALEAPVLNSARSVILTDADSGRILYSENAYTRSEPASLTKVMTLLLAVEAIENNNASLDDSVTASSHCVEGIENDSSSLNIYQGETMSLEDLLYCAALASADESCNIIAEHISGSIEDFVKLMNEKAEQLGCTGTHFENTHGMPASNHYTTAYDLSLIAHEAMSHELFEKLVSTEKYAVGATNNHAKRELVNTNALLTADSPYGSKYVYEGAKGIKTGHTQAAGLCLMTSAERNGIDVICVVLGASGDSATESYDSFNDTITLLDWVFDNFSYRCLASQEDIVGTQPVINGDRQGKINLYPTEALNALVPKDINVYQLKKEITLYSDSVENTSSGAELGEMTLFDDNGNELGTVKLVAKGNIIYEQTSPDETEVPSASISGMQKNAIFIAAAILALVVFLVILAAVRKVRFVKARRAGKR